MALSLGIVASGKLNATGLIPTYRGYATKVDNSVTPKTWASVPIGPASSTRTVIAVVTAWAPDTRTITSCTIGGIAATEDYNAGGSQRLFSVYRATVPTGTSADITVVCDDGSPEVTIAAWTVPTAITKTAATKTTVNAGATSGSVSCACAAGGFALAGYASRSNALTTMWAGITERYDTGLAQPASGGDSATLGGTHTVTATFSAAITNATRIGLITYQP